MTTRADLEATIRAHVHPAGFGFWCTEGEDLPAELAGVLDAHLKQAEAALALLRTVDAAGME